MTDTSDFEIKLLSEKNSVIARLKDINQIILDEMSYMDKKKAIEYYGQVDMIIFAIDKEYEEIRNRGKTTQENQ